MTNLSKTRTKETDEEGGTHHFVESRRVLERVRDLDELSPLLLLIRGDEAQLGAEVLHVAAEVLHHLEALAEVPETGAEALLSQDF